MLTATLPHCTEHALPVASELLVTFGTRTADSNDGILTSDAFRVHQKATKNKGFRSTPFQCVERCAYKPRHVEFGDANDAEDVVFPTRKVKQPSHEPTRSKARQKKPRRPWLSGLVGLSLPQDGTTMSSPKDTHGRTTNNPCLLCRTYIKKLERCVYFRSNFMININTAYTYR